MVARPLAEILSKYDLMEMHVSLTHGLWRYENWGYPVGMLTTKTTQQNISEIKNENIILVDASPGAELWVWFNAGNRTEQYIDEQWKELCGILSGLFCASLSFIDKSNTVQPEFTFRPTFSPGAGVKNHGNVDNSKYQIRYATLPREIVCTENLTPWKKLLPVHPHEGLVSLLNSGFIHSTNYHSLGVHVRRLRSAPKTSSLSSVQDGAELIEIRQTVNLVFDTKIVTTSNDWSLRKLFGQGVNGASEMADSSMIYVDVSDSSFRLTPQPSETILSQRGGSTTHLAKYDVKKDYHRQMFSIAAVYDAEDEASQQKPNVNIALPPPIYAKRFRLGVGQERGKIVTKLTNTHWTTLNVIIQENLPWFVPVYLHTLSINVNGMNRKIEPNAVKYVPGRLREQPSQLEIAFKCPGRSTVDIKIDFDFVFLKWLEYPPDANHGHYIGSSIITVQLPVARNFTAIPIDGHLFADSFNASRSGYLVNIRTESILITLPTPDFSMPYNVICLACTVVALAFGPIHNFSTKKLTYGKKSTKGDGDQPKTVFEKLKKLIFANR